MTRSGPAEGRNWYRIQAQADGPAMIHLYDEIGYYGITAQDFIRELAGVDGPVEVHINSPGGDIGDGYAIYNSLVSRPDVTTVVDGTADSAASVVLMAGEQRLMAPTSTMLIHDGWANFAGNAAAMQSMAKRLETASALIAEVYAATAGGTAGFWRQQMTEETTYSPKQALEAGLITGITANGRRPAAVPAGAAPAGVIVAAGITAADAEQIVNAAGGNAGWVQRDGNWVYDPDGDGDDDSSASTDTDHSHWSADGTQTKSIPPNPATGKGGKPMPGNQAGPGPQAASVDNSPWDASKAWAAGSAADNSESFFRGICAGHHTSGDPSTQAYWALPYRYTPGGAPNAGGVRAAWAALNGSRGGVADLADRAAAEAKVKGLMKQVNPDWEPGNSAAGASAANTKGNTMEHDDALTIEGRRTRIGEITGELQDIAGQYPASVLPGDVQARWNTLRNERRLHKEALDSVEARNADLAEALAPAVTGGGTGSGQFDTPRPAAGVTPLRQAPAVHIQHDIYNLGEIRQQAHSEEELPGLYRENALRVNDVARFPGSDRETAQANVAKLLDRLPDDPTGMVARRIIATGNPGYQRAFGRALAAGNPGVLGRDDARILALGESDTGAYAVPFELDPTVILTSSGVVNPLRQIADVRQIAGKELDLVTAGAVTVSRVAEGGEAQDSTPTLGQPKVSANRVSGTVKFSVELEGDWRALQASMSQLLADAKDVEEATSFLTGNGTAPNAGGIIGTLAGGSVITGQGGAVGTGVVAISDFSDLETALPPRFRSNASLMALRSVYNAYRVLFLAQPGEAAIPWATPGTSGPETYPAYENSSMSAAATAATVLLLGDVRAGFLIVDRVGMNMELIPFILGTNGRPTGQRMYFAWWRNNSVIKTSNAIRVLKLK